MNRLEKAMWKNRLDYSSLARKIGKSRQCVSRQVKRGFTNQKGLAKLYCDALGISTRGIYKKERRNRMDN